MRGRSSCFLLSLSLAISSCGTRQETAAYFEAVTGIPICPSAKVTNRRMPEQRYAGIGVVYSARLGMSQTCQHAFLQKVKAFQERASPSAAPRNTVQGRWIDVTSDGENLIVIYTE